MNKCHIFNSYVKLPEGIYIYIHIHILYTYHPDTHQILIRYFSDVELSSRQVVTDGGSPKADRLGSARPCRGARGAHGQQLWFLRLWNALTTYFDVYIYICIIHSMYILHTIGLFQVSIAKPSHSYWIFRSVAASIATEPRPLPWAFMECWKPWAAWAPQS